MAASAMTGAAAFGLAPVPVLRYRRRMCVRPVQRRPRAVTVQSHLPASTPVLAGILPGRSVAKQKILPRIADFFKNLPKHWAALNIRNGDLVLAIACFLFQEQVLRFFHAVYVAIANRVDRTRGRELRPRPYSSSIFSTMERTGVLQAGGGIATATMLIQIAFALASGCLGISDPIKGGTHVRFRRIATACFFGWTVAKTKRVAILRGFPGSKVIRTQRQRFVLNRILDTIILMLVTVAAVDATGFPIASLATLGGIGGLALGLASKEIGENLFGGAALLVTSPFSPGDAIVSPHVRGVVTDVGFYTTRVTAFDGTVSVVPNSLFTNAAITNLSRARSRRFHSKFRLRYCDVGVVEDIVNSLRAALKELRHVDRSAYIRAHLTGYDEVGISVEVACMFLVADYEQYLEFQQGALLTIAEKVEDAGAEFATFPIDVLSQ